MVQRLLLKQPALTKMSERTDMVQPALVVQLKDTSRELSPLYEEDQPPKCFKCCAIGDLVVCLSAHSLNIKG